MMKSFLGGNTAKKTQADTETLKEIMEYLSDDTKIMEQITAPSEAWVMERLGRVEDILEIQPVTSDNDPNGLLHQENGGYTACIYFTSTGIESAGDSPVSRGTDGGGAVEVYSTVQDAEARCEYLSGFDNTILYTGSYAIVGTMVIRISYAYTDEAQYEMTDRIAKWKPPDALQVRMKKFEDQVCWKGITYEQKRKRICTGLCDTGTDGAEV